MSYLAFWQPFRCTGQSTGPSKKRDDYDCVVVMKRGPKWRDPAEF